MSTSEAGMETPQQKGLFGLRMSWEGLESYELIARKLESNFDEGGYGLGLWYLGSRQTDGARPLVGWVGVGPACPPVRAARPHALTAACPPFWQWLDLRSGGGEGQQGCGRAHAAGRPVLHRHRRAGNCDAQAGEGLCGRRGQKRDVMAPGARGSFWRIGRARPPGGRSAPGPLGWGEPRRKSPSRSEWAMGRRWGPGGRRPLMVSAIGLQIHSLYRRTGASFQKAQQEFAAGVFSNPAVRTAAASAAAGAAENAFRAP